MILTMTMTIQEYRLAQHNNTDQGDDGDEEDVDDDTDDIRNNCTVAENLAVRSASDIFDEVQSPDRVCHCTC